MHRFGFYPLFSIFFAACAVFAQDIAPVRQSDGNAPQDARQMLEAARAKIMKTTGRLTNYTCLESIDRNYYVPKQERLSRKVMTESATAACKRVEFSPITGLLHQASDRLRMQVAIGSGEEIDAWASSPVFGSSSIYEMVPQGPTSTGPFGPILVDVFENKGTQFYFLGRRQRGGAQEVYAYQFRVPLEASHFETRTGKGFTLTAYSGSFDIYTATADLAEMSYETDELPPSAPMCRSRFHIDYHVSLIGDGELLLPAESEFDTVTAGREQTKSLSVFSACHEYVAESNLTFGNDVPQNPKAPVSSQSGLSLPPGLPVTLSVPYPISLGSAAGDPVEAKVTNSVRDPKSKRILIPADTIARGRITLMRHVFAPNAEYIVSVSFNAVEVNGVVSAISLRPERSKPSARSEQGLRARGQEFTLPSLAEEQEVTVAFSALSVRYAVPANWKSKWVTR